MYKKLLWLNTAQFRVSSLFYLGNFFLNFFRYLFHLLLLRVLSPGEYGEFLAYLSLMYLLAIPTGTISSIVTKVVSDYNGKKDYVSINAFFYYIIRKTVKVALITGLLLILGSKSLSLLFKAHQVAFVVLGISAFFTVFQTVINSYLLGLHKFLFQTVLGFFNVTLTIILALIFIKLGFGPVGAISAQLLSGVMVTVASLLYIRHQIYPRNNKKPSYIIDIKKYANYSFLNSLGVMALMSVDILMVRILFSSHLSGVYSSISVLGRMIIFGLAPLSSLILPIASKKFSEGKNHTLVFQKLGVTTLILGISAGSIFYFFPKTLINILSGANFLESANLLPAFGISVVLFSFSQFILSYLMATNRQTANVFLLIAAVLQPVVIYVNHSSLQNVIKSNLVLQVCLLFSLIFVLLKPLPSSVKIKHVTQI